MFVLLSTKNTYTQSSWNSINNEVNKSLFNRIQILIILLSSSTFNVTDLPFGINYNSTENQMKIITEMKRKIQK
jgi:hypothetical protein